MGDVQKDEKIKGAVRQHYGEIARRFVEEPAQTSCCGPAPAAKTAQASCCGPAPVAEAPAGTDAARLYPVEELAGLPDTVTDASLGCGNPLAIAELKPGEVVLDLGSGGGIDCFLAARKVGPQGRVIGLDMTPDMIKLARRNAKKLGMANVIFDYGEMEEIPLVDASVDVIISNCVINLSPDKPRVFAETWRVLKPGGRLAISDVVAFAELPEALRQDLALYTGCMAGASLVSEVEAMLAASGFSEIRVTPKDASRSFIRDWAPGTDVADYVVSAMIEAIKPVA